MPTIHILTIKKISVLVSIAWLFLAPMNTEALPGKYGFSLTPLTGILYGRSEEIVYKYSGRDDYLSELLWDLKPLPYLGFAADFSLRDPFQGSGFISSASAKFGLPIKVGIMEDRDWKNLNQDLTHFSSHDAYSQNAILAELSAGYSWRLMDFLALSACGDFSFMHFSWMAEDGYTQYPAGKDGSGNYPPWNSNYPKSYNYGPGIRYIQNWFILAPGISLKGKINEYFSIEGKFGYSPLIYCYDRDDHLLRGLIFWDYLAFGNYINGGAEFTYTPIKNFDLSLSVFYRYISGPRGTNHVKATVDGYDDLPKGQLKQTSTDGVGAGYSVLNVELAAKFMIF